MAAHICLICEEVFIARNPRDKLCSPECRRAHGRILFHARPPAYLARRRLEHREYFRLRVDSERARKRRYGEEHAREIAEQDYRQRLAWAVLRQYGVVLPEGSESHQQRVALAMLEQFGIEVPSSPEEE